MRTYNVIHTEIQFIDVGSRYRNLVIKLNVGIRTDSNI